MAFPSSRTQKLSALFMANRLGKLIKILFGIFRSAVHPYACDGGSSAEGDARGVALSFSPNAHPSASTGANSSFSLPAADTSLWLGKLITLHPAIACSLLDKLTYFWSLSVDVWYIHAYRHLQIKVAARRAYV
jgi:hypothetical protein